MGSDICCFEKFTFTPPLKVIASRPTKIKTSNLPRLGDASSTSESPTFNRNDSILLPTPIALKKHLSFTSFISQQQIKISSIKRISQSRQECCSQQKNILNYLEKLSNEILALKEQNKHNHVENFINREQKTYFDSQKFIQHANTCSVCYELYESFKNLQIEESLKNQLMSEKKRKSMRDSLLETEPLDVGSTQDSSCNYFTTMITPEQTKKSMKKFPNVNKCQSKRLRFRKTSNFEPEIKEARESEQSISTKEV